MQRSPVLTLSTASASWNLCTNGKFKTSVKATLVTPDFLARRYEWEDMRGSPKSLRHRSLQKQALKQDSKAMLAFALGRRSSFYDVWTHSLSWWAVPFEGRIGVFFGISFLQCWPVSLLHFRRVWLITHLGWRLEDLRKIHCWGQGSGQGKNSAHWLRLAFPRRTLQVWKKKPFDKENIYTN